MTNDDLIQKLIAYRLENQITQEVLAETLGVTYAALNRWLNGRSKPSQLHAYQIEKLLSKKGRKR